MVAERLPQHLAPLDVVIAIKVAAANCVGRKLQLPEDQADGNGPSAQLNGARGRFRLKKSGKMFCSFHLPANCFSDKQRFISQLFDKIEEGAGIYRLSYMLVESRGQ